MTVLLNWCGSWTEMFPYPPLSELGRVRVLLELHDPQLSDHLSACGASADAFAWPMMRTVFSEVLSREQVLIAATLSACCTFATHLLLVLRVLTCCAPVV